jgi:type I restriction system adenine methylase (hsdM)
LKVNALIEQEKSLNKSIKELEAQLLTKIMHTIKQLSDSEITELLEHQWIDPIMDQVHKLFDSALKDFTKGLQKLSEKYAITLSDLETQIQESGKVLSEMIDELSGDDFDIQGLEAFKSLLNN